MKLKKKDLLEIVDANGELIGKNDIPTTGADLETQASHTTDYNAKVGTQPYRYDMLGRFGFTLMPFMEGKEEQVETFFDELTGLMHNRFVDITDYYIKHPNLLKPDNRKAKEESVGHNKECEERDIKWAKEVTELLERYFGSGSNDKKIDEAAVIEDKVIDKKSEDEMSKKSEDDEIKDKKLQKVAGLINKLDKKDIDKLINLLERQEPREETEFSADEKQKINDFIKNYKGDFKDEDIHAFAEKLKLDIPELEEYIYNIARKGLK